MFKFALAMLIPLWVCVYTVQFGRWMRGKDMVRAALSAYAVAIVAFVVAGAVLWRMFT